MHAAIPPGGERSTDRAISAVRELVTAGFRHALLAAAGFLVIAAFAAVRLPRIVGAGTGARP
jgi:hypothetical protein